MAMEDQRAGGSLKNPKWIVELQSLRGLAASIVLLHHCSFYYVYDIQLRNALEVTFNAHAAVVGFFVLSGFVLGLSLSKEKLNPRSAADFFIRRAFRIYPALWVASILAASYMIFVYPAAPSPVVSNWWYELLPAEPLTAIGMAKSLVGFGRALPIPIWTITIELVGSVVVLALMCALNFRQWIFAAASFTLLLMSFLGDRLLTAYLYQFGLGVSITFVAPLLRKSQMPRGWALALLILTLALMLFGRQLGGMAWSFANGYNAFWPNLIESLSAAVLISIIYVRPELFPLLRMRFPKFLGDISYSLYILHLPTMAFIAFFLGDVLHLSAFSAGGVTAMLSLSFGTTVVVLGVSVLSYKYVEKPGIEWGRRLVDARSRVVSARTEPGR